MNTPSIQWFPGHMAKTRRIMKENLKLVDLLVELRDARIPNASKNPEIEKLAGDKPRIVLLAKADLADYHTTQRWLAYYEKQGLPVLAVNTKNGQGLESFPSLVEKTLAPLLAHRKDRGMEGLAVRMMVVGVPNVGKSSFINRMAGGRPTRVEDRPGVTMHKQWIKVDRNIELLDMPGVLWPKFEDPVVGEHLALTGAVKDQVVDVELLAMRLLKRLVESYPDQLEVRYKMTTEDTHGLEDYQLLELAGRKRGMLLPGAEIDTLRVANTVLDDFRQGRLGNISLEDPPHE